MHAQHGGAAVHHFAAPVRQHEGDGAAASLVHLPQFPDLPGHPGFVEDGPDLLDELTVGIVAPCLAPGTGVLGQGHPVAQKGRVVLFRHFREHGVQAAVHIPGEHLAVFHGFIEIQQAAPVLESQQLHDEFGEIGRLHAGVSVGPDFLLVREEGRLGLFSRHRLQDGFQVGIGAHPVVLAVAGDQGPVKAHIPALQGRHQFQFRRGEVFLLHPVAVLQERHQGILRLLVPVRMGADHRLELFPGDPFRQGLLHLVLGHVDQQIRNVEHRILFVHADVHLKGPAVFGVDDPHQGQGQTGPLVLLDAPVVMGAEIHHPVLFMDRVPLQVQPGRIDVGAHDLQSLMDRFPADHRQDAGLALLVPVHLVPGLQLARLI